MALKIKQIQVVSVPDVYNTQCHAFMYALCEDGSLWFKRDNDEKWQPETVPQIKEAQNTIDNKHMVQCCKCGVDVKINKEHYHCKKCFNSITDAQHHV